MKMKRKKLNKSKSNKKNSAMRKDRENTIFLRLTESWVGVVACCSYGRASVHHENLKNEEKEARGGGRNGSK